MRFLYLAIVATALSIGSSVAQPTDPPVSAPPTASEPAPPAKQPLSAVPAATPTLTPAPQWFVVTLIATVGAAGLLCVLATNAALRSSDWSIADALSEDVEMPVKDAGGVLIMSADGKPLTAPRMVASSSRLIAFIGLLGILSLYVGYGAAVLFYFASGQGAPPGTDDVRTFLFAGLTLFAPYIVNKFSSVFTGATPHK